jgi:hypothetical protein
MLADKDFVVAGAVEPFDEFEVALETKRGVFAGAMEWRHENAEFHRDGSPFADVGCFRPLFLFYWP